MNASTVRVGPKAPGSRLAVWAESGPPLYFAKGLLCGQSDHFVMSPAGLLYSVDLTILLDIRITAELLI